MPKKLALIREGFEAGYWDGDQGFPTEVMVRSQPIDVEVSGRIPARERWIGDSFGAKDPSTATERLRGIDRAVFEEVKAVAHGAVVGGGKVGRVEEGCWAGQLD